MTSSRFRKLKTYQTISIIDDGIPREAIVKDINRRMSRVQLSNIVYYDTKRLCFYDTIEEFTDQLDEFEEDADERIDDLEEFHVTPYWIDYRDIKEA